MATIPGTPGPDPLDGTAEGDSITGLNGNDSIFGFDGNDTILGGGGDDNADGGSGNDRIYGGSGRDRLLSGTGVDSLYGGADDDVVTLGTQSSGGGSYANGGDGNDTVSYTVFGANTLIGGTGEADLLKVSSGASSLYFIVDGGDGSVDDGNLSSISGFERYFAQGAGFADIAAFAGGADTFHGGGGADTAFGQGGDDALYGDSGADALDGGDGKDIIYGGTQDDTVTGGIGNDYLVGGNGADVIDAGAGADRIALYLGNDSVTGGSGADRFLFNSNQTGRHFFTDFESGVDRLEFNEILFPNSPPIGALQPADLSYGAAVGSAAQFVVVYDAATDQTALNWDQNGADPSGGVYGLAIFDGNLTLLYTDILII